MQPHTKGRTSCGGEREFAAADIGGIEAWATYALTCIQCRPMSAKKTALEANLCRHVWMSVLSRLSARMKNTMCC
eukprot:774364-Amphidinium_carterae.2